jgi:hypothetical protein
MRRALPVIAIALCGCRLATPQFKPVPASTLPILPPYKEVWTAIPVSAPQKPFSIAWDYFSDDTRYTFEVWSSTNLFLWWAMVTNTPVKTYSCAPVKTMELFRVRAKDGATGEVSDWATR